MNKEQLCLKKLSVNEMVDQYVHPITGWVYRKKHDSVGNKSTKEVLARSREEQLALKRKYNKAYSLRKKLANGTITTEQKMWLDEYNKQRIFVR